MDLEGYYAKWNRSEKDKYLMISYMQSKTQSLKQKHTVDL